VDFATLNPGYVANFVTSKNQWDSQFTMVPVVGTGTAAWNTLDLRCNLSISSAINPLQKPKDEIRVAALAPPINNESLPYILDTDQSSAIAVANVTDGYYFFSSKADCSGTVETCNDNVEAEVSCYLVYNMNVSHFPYQMINQRRTGKFQLLAPNWVHYWLVITSDLLDANGLFNLYLGTQFWQGSDSGVQMFVNYGRAGYPTGPSGSTDLNIAAAFYPTASQHGDWISPPLPLKVGIYYVGAMNSYPGTTAYFTNKVGFNQPPTQAANPHASLSRFGLLAVVSLSCLITANVFKQF